MSFSLVFFSLSTFQCDDYPQASKYRVFGVCRSESVSVHVLHGADDGDDDEGIQILLVNHHRFSRSECCFVVQNSVLDVTTNKQINNMVRNIKNF